MGNKSQAIAELEKHTGGATLIDNSSPNCYDVELEAPRGYSWGGDMHSFVVNEFNSGDKSIFWDGVIEDIHNALDDAAACGGDCEYWYDS